MWPFHKSRSQSLSELIEEVAKLRRTVEERDLDWIDMRARCKRLLDRTEKAAKVIQDGTPEEPASPDGTEPGVGSGGFLTPRQKALQQQILRRRLG